jgi:hypothetical protein
MRYRIALRLEKLLEPFAKASGYITLPAIALDTYREYFTASLLQSLTQAGIEFDPEIEVRGAEHIPESGAFLLSGHFYLNFVFMRWLHDRGREHSVFLLLGVDDWRIVGTRQQMRVLDPGSASLLQARRRIRSDELVLAAVDYHQPHPKRVKVECAERGIFITENIFKLAYRLRRPILFFDASLEAENKIVVRIEPATSNSPFRAADEYGSYLQRALSRRSKETPPLTLLEPTA